MPSHRRLLKGLPSLYRPEETDSGPLPDLLRGIAAALDGLGNEMGEVMQTHWYPYADEARFSPYLRLDRRRRGLGSPDPRDPDDRAEIEGFPYLHDLARLGGLLGLPPWREPRALRELVEDYRRRLAECVALYRNGLGTPVAMRTMVESELPLDRDLPRAQQERGFSIEEPVARITRLDPFATHGQPDALVGPLMRIDLTNDGLAPAAPTIYIQGQAPAARIDATTDPLLEHFDPDGDLPGLGIGYQGTLAAGQTLRLRPACQGWLGRPGTLEQARTEPSGQAPADPTVPGPWSAAAGAPADVRVLYQSRDRCLWAASGSDGLWRHDGSAWTRVLMTSVHCLAELGQELLAGSDDGLQAIGLYPADGEPFATRDIAALAGTPVRAIAIDGDGRPWLGTDDGASRLDGGTALVPSPLTGTSVHAVYADRGGLLYFGGPLGLFRHRPGSGTDPGDWYWYRGEDASDQVPDWAPLGDSLPAPGEVFLPPVTSILRGRDAALWIGTARGPARYIARHEGGWTYRTLLEAFPDLADTPVSAIREDARGLVWLATGRGLLRYDGRDLEQYQAAAGWVGLGRAGRLYSGEDPPSNRGPWRFDHGTNRWQRFNDTDAAWIDVDTAPATTVETPVQDLIWTDSVVADLGTFDGSVFTHQSDVPATALRLRCKPDQTRIIAGGLPAIPRLPVGVSTWRYLSMTPREPPTARPWWSPEGQLYPVHTGQTPYPGRYDPVSVPAGAPEVFAYRPAARVWVQWAAPRPFAALVRLRRRAPGETLHPEIIERVWRGMQRVRPAGVGVMLALDDEILRGNPS